MNRRRVAQKAPPSGLDLTRFPRATLTPRPRFRAHSATRGVWWFSASGDGRFDLVATTPDGPKQNEPVQGTCYLADDVRTAVRERLGELVADRQEITVARADEMVVTTVMPPAGRHANVTSPTADGFGATRELSTMTDYEVLQAWAAAFHVTGFAGVRYASRFTSAAGPNACAVFGTVGATAPPDRVVRGAPVPSTGDVLDGRSAAAEAGIALRPPVPARRGMVVWVSGPPRR